MNLAVIFDLDGTLVNTLHPIVETYLAALKSMDVTCIGRPMIRATIGLSLEQGFSSLLGVAQDDDKVIYGVQQYHILYREIVLAKAKELIFPGILEGLSLLKKQGVQLAVATVSVYKNAEALLKEAELWQYFSVVVGVDQVVHSKLTGCHEQHSVDFLQRILCDTRKAEPNSSMWEGISSAFICIPNMFVTTTSLLDSFKSQAYLESKMIAIKTIFLSF